MRKKLIFPRFYLKDESQEEITGGFGLNFCQLRSTQLIKEISEPNITVLLSNLIIILKTVNELTVAFHFFDAVPRATTLTFESVSALVTIDVSIVALPRAWRPLFHVTI